MLSERPGFLLAGPLMTPVTTLGQWVRNNGRPHLQSGERAYLEFLLLLPMRCGVEMLRLIWKNGLYN